MFSSLVVKWILTCEAGPLPSCAAIVCVLNKEYLLYMPVLEALRLW
jgi:hypothetical protein